MSGKLDLKGISEGLCYARKGDFHSRGDMVGAVGFKWKIWKG